MYRFFFASVFIFFFVIRGLNAQAAPQIKCEIGVAAWCIATFDGSISMQDAGESRVWKLHARTADSDLSMKVFETKACSEVADEQLRMVQDDRKTYALSTVNHVIEYELNANGCKLRFEIPQGKSASTYRQVMLYGILVGPQKRRQLYEVK